MIDGNYGNHGNHGKPYQSTSIPSACFSKPSEGPFLRTSPWWRRLKPLRLDRGGLLYTSGLETSASAMEVPQGLVSWGLSHGGSPKPKLDAFHGKSIRDFPASHVSHMTQRSPRRGLDQTLRNWTTPQMGLSINGSIPRMGGLIHGKSYINA